jgi:hypothetical protein
MQSILPSHFSHFGKRMELVIATRLRFVDTAQVHVHCSCHRNKALLAEFKRGINACTISKAL